MYLEFVIWVVRKLGNLLVILVFDLDLFVCINNLLGYEVGDELLKKIIDCL